MDTTRSILKFIFWLSALIILLAGANPKDYRLTDGATHTVANGYSFSKYALGMSKPIFDQQIISTLNEDGFAIELSLKPPKKTHSNFMVLSSITNGINGEQFLIGQWAHILIVMSGDDYANHSEQPRMNIDTRKLSSDTWDLELIFSPAGAVAMHDGDVVASSPDYIVTLPGALKPTSTEKNGTQKVSEYAASILTLGNTLDRRHGWMGGVKQLIISHLAPSQEIGKHVAGKKIVAYDFTKGEANFIANDKVDATVEILPNSSIQQFQWYGSSSDYFQNGKVSLIDIVLNFSGFIPFGLTFCGLMLAYNGRTASLIKTVTLTLLVSLALEFLQGAIPSRDSTIFDVIFNTAGGLVGALMCLFFWTLAQPPKEDLNEDKAPEEEHVEIFDESAHPKSFSN